VVPSVTFELLYVFIIVRLTRRELIWINATSRPTAEWIIRQITEAFPWNEAPLYLIRDRDQVYGTAVRRRLRTMGIRDKPIAPRSPWQNGVAERLIGSIRRECTDHIIVFGEAHLRRVLKSYATYYNAARTHRSLSKTRRSHDRFIGRDASYRIRSLADCTTNTPESEFSVHTAGPSSSIRAAHSAFRTVGRFRRTRPTAPRASVKNILVRHSCAPWVSRGKSDERLAGLRHRLARSAANVPAAPMLASI
jgi:hypothetical protein